MIEIVAVNVIVAPTVAVHVHGNTTVALIVRSSALDERGEQREDGSHNPF